MGKSLRRVLIVDDEAPVREFVTRALAHAGYETDQADDGLTALDALEHKHFDLVITDIVMPGMDGIALALKLAKEQPDLKILLMTGYAAEKQRAYGLDSFIHEVIGKPFTLRQIVDAVGRALKNSA
ncbi:response regulator [Fodinicurvata sp. EGI_FJ10296]|uniref:response regulator n=1 Tax=Fodinicurvata sp. EGI_FJ10296 TaxID=3231908 RepID=UPI003453F6B9